MMKREEVLERLKKWIPSFRREYTGYPNGEWDWLFRNDYDTHAPTKIPYDFLEGEKMVDSRGRELIVSSRHLRPSYIEYKKTHGELPGRHIHWNYTTFAGHPHHYMTLKTSGQEFTFQEDGKTWSTTVWDSELEKYPKLKQASRIMETKLYRILPQEEIDENPLDWDHYEAGDVTERFLDAAEMFATAAFVTLYRFEGPLVLLNSDYCVAYDKKDLILSVSSRDNVRIYSKALRMLVEE